MPREATLLNISVLVSLRFLGSFKFSTEEVAEFLGVSNRQARNILNYMESQGWIRKLSHKSWQPMDEMPEKAYGVLRHITEFINSSINTSKEC